MNSGALFGLSVLMNFVASGIDEALHLAVVARDDPRGGAACP